MKKYRRWSSVGERKRKYIEEGSGVERNGKKYRRWTLGRREENEEM